MTPTIDRLLQGAFLSMASIDMHHVEDGEPEDHLHVVRTSLTVNLKPFRVEIGALRDYCSANFPDGYEIRWQEDVDDNERMIVWWYFRNREDAAMFKLRVGT